MAQTTKAVVLAAGMGTRVAEYIDGRQKCMLKHEGKPLLHHIFENLEGAGIDDTYCVVGYRAQEVRDYFSSTNTDINIHFLYDSGYQEDSSSRSLLVAEDSLGSGFIFSHGEIFYKQKLIDDIISANVEDCAAMVAVSPDPSVAPSHPDVCTSDGTIEEFYLYPLKDGVSGEYTYMGVSWLSSEIFEYVNEEPRVSDALASLLQDGNRIRFVIYEGPWKHIGTPQDLEKLSR